ncbi:MAG TPA: hypothetical protein VH092_23680, partial [Urbifossiella sp.]|nr:hypothetical protein [Urbifossiella sp.]
MTLRPTSLAAAAVLAGLMLGVTLDAPAQPLPPPPPGAPPAAGSPDGTEVLARGPVHEAFATTAEQAIAGEVEPQAPPDPIEELPPDQKPDGDNVTWIPGYWSWDAERTDYIWVSGFWRVPPPGRVWVPGSWHAVQGGFQWVSGFWQPVAPQQPAQPAAPQELEYLPAPPAPIEVGPAVPAPGPDYVYVTGSWVWRGRYLWRPGVWIGYRPGWVYVPAHFRWTPVGYIFVDGYWDYPLATRGVLFTPVYVPRRAVVRGFVYTPTYVVAEPVLFGALFVRRGYGAYYFGDYYDRRYVGFGYRPWCSPAVVTQVNIGIGRGYAYDPLWNYYSVAHRAEPAWHTTVTTTYVGRYEGNIPRPPHTLVQQNTAIQRITNVTNVTNNITVVNNTTNNHTAIHVANKDVSNVVMVAPLAAAPKLQPQTQFHSITAAARQQEATHAQDLRQVAVRRQEAETAALKAHPPVAAPKAEPGHPPPVVQPVKVKLDVPQAAVAKAHAFVPDKAPPAPPIAHPKVDPKIDHLVSPTPKYEPKATPVPKFEPKGPTPQPKFEPKLPPTPQPKFEPTPQPKFEPKSPPTPQPPPVPKF